MSRSNILPICSICRMRLSLAILSKRVLPFIRSLRPLNFGVCPINPHRSRRFNEPSSRRARFERRLNSDVSVLLWAWSRVGGCLARERWAVDSADTFRVDLERPSANPARRSKRLSDSHVMSPSPSPVTAKTSLPKRSTRRLPHRANGSHETGALLPQPH